LAVQVDQQDEEGTVDLDSARERRSASRIDHFGRGFVVEGAPGKGEFRFVLFAANLKIKS